MADLMTYKFLRINTPNPLEFEKHCTNEINHYAKEGWIVHTMRTQTLGDHDYELVVLLHKPAHQVR